MKFHLVWTVIFVTYKLGNTYELNNYIQVFRNQYISVITWEDSICLCWDNRQYIIRQLVGLLRGGYHKLFYCTRNSHYCNFCELKIYHFVCYLYSWKQFLVSLSWTVKSWSEMDINSGSPKPNKHILQKMKTNVWPWKGADSNIFAEKNNLSRKR